MKVIDIDSWDRRSHYEWFSAFADPTLAMNVRMDVTRLLGCCCVRKISTFAALMYIVCSCINNIAAFRLRTLRGEVVELDRADVAYTVLTDSGNFVNCRAPMGRGFHVFAKKVAENRCSVKHSYIQKQFNDTSVVSDIYCSCVPWIDFTAVRQPIPDNDEDNKSIPRVCWGKYVKDSEKVYMTLNITANHALVDGLNLAQAFIDIQQAFYEPEKYLGND